MDFTQYNKRYFQMEQRLHCAHLSLETEIESVVFMGEVWGEESGLQ